MNLVEPVPTGREQQSKQNMTSDWFQFAIGLKEYVRQTEEEIKGTLSQRITHLLGQIEKMENKLREVNKYTIGVNTSDIVNLNVGGKTVQVGKQLLMRAQESQLAHLFANQHTLKMDQDQRVFLDRDPDAFNFVIKYLRSNGEYSIDDVEPSQKKLASLELKFWGLDNYKMDGSMEDIISQNRIDIDKLLLQDPLMFQGMSTVALEKWKNLSPLTSEKILQKSNIPADYNFDGVETRDHFVDTSGQRVFGHCKLGTEVLHGVARVIDQDNQISEGWRQDGKLNGFGRIIWASGNVYIGMLKEHKLHGFGKYILANGKEEEGEWNQDEFVTEQTEQDSESKREGNKAKFDK